jgi:hypothetical protein
MVPDEEGGGVTDFTYYIVVGAVVSVLGALSVAQCERGQDCERRGGQFVRGYGYSMVCVKGLEPMP